MADFYDLLGVSRDADADTLKELIGSKLGNITLT